MIKFLKKLFSRRKALRRALWEIQTEEGRQVQHDIPDVNPSEVSYGTQHVLLVDSPRAHPIFVDDKMTF